MKHLLTISDTQKTKGHDKAVTRRSEEGRARAAKEQTAGKTQGEPKSIKLQSIEVQEEVNRVRKEADERIAALQ